MDKRMAGLVFGYSRKSWYLALLCLFTVANLSVANIANAQASYTVQKLSILVQADPNNKHTDLIDTENNLNEFSVSEFLVAVQSAARNLDYDGIYIYQSGARIQSTRIIHIVDGTGEKERVEILDGRPRECLRNNGVEQCLLPERKHIISRPARSDHFPGILLANVPAIYNYYEWRRSNHVFRIAGRDCAVSELRALDNLRYSYRFCTDLETNLLLKMQTINAVGELVDQLAFTRIKIGTDVSPEKLQSHWDTRNWSIWSEASKPIDLQDLDIQFAWPSGFTPVAAMNRLLAPNHEVTQIVISDGLAAISVFIETFKPEIVQKFRQGSLHEGAVNIYRHQLDTNWLTIVGEVPKQTIKQLADNIQLKPEAAQ